MFGIEPKKFLILLLVVAAILAWRDWNSRDIVHDPGILVAESPNQIETPEMPVIAVKGYQLTPRAMLQIRARVLSRKNYRFGSEADLSPVDLALGWQVMSDQAVLDQIEVTQGSRWYYTRYQLPAPISDQAIIEHSGNMHMIPAATIVSRKLKSVRIGDIVRLQGLLVDADHDSGWHWRTSRSRTDTGAGSCEIIYLQDIQIEERP